MSLLSFMLLGLVLYLPLSLVTVPLFFLSPLSPKAMDLYYFLMHKMVNFYLSLGPLKYRVRDFSKLPEGACILVSNHRSHLDMYLFLAGVNRVRAVASAYLLKVPIIGQVLWMSGHFIMKPGDLKAYKRALAQITEALKRQHRVLLFPELHRCEEGFEGMHKFHLTAFQLAREHRVPLVPVVIAHSDSVWPKGQLSANFSHTVSVKVLDPIDPHSFPDSATLSKHTHALMLTELKDLSQ